MVNSSDVRSMPEARSCMSLDGCCRRKRCRRHRRVAGYSSSLRFLVRDSAHLFFVDANLAVFLHPLTKSGGEHLERLFTFPLKQGFTHLRDALGHLFRRGLLLVGNHEHRTASADADGTTDVALVQRKRYSTRIRHASDIRYLARGRHQFAGLIFRADLFRRLLQVVFGPRFLRQLLSLLCQQRLGAIDLVLVLNLSANLVKRRSRRRLHIRHLVRQRSPAASLRFPAHLCQGR